MKPSWKDAPDWANWLAGDAYGFVWAEFEPPMEDGQWIDDDTGKFISFGASDIRRDVFKDPRP